MSGTQRWSIAVATTLGLGLFAANAGAQDLSACGENMYIRAEATCEFEPPATCTAKCTPLTVEAACAADLSVSCEGQCNASLDVQCQASCSGSCQAECKVDPGKFDCVASCRGSCEADCDANCKARPGDAHCAASCRASCTGSCDASCDVRLPEADCKAKCDASCSGSCKADANFDCQVDCQAQGYVDCSAKVEGGCKAECMTNPEGGLFCDGQFVKSSNIDQCIDALQGLLDIEVEGYASGMCSNGTCSSEAGASCSALNAKDSGISALAGLLLFGTVSAFRRRRNKSA